jgi:enamine deaminase RidA (YjgF/YER057c/UK114 family)
MVPAMRKRQVQVARPSTADSGVSPGVILDDVLYISGQVAQGIDLPTQVRGAWEAVLDIVRTAGASPQDIVKLTVFTKDPAAWSHLRPLIEEEMDTPPAVTTVTVIGLGRREDLVEIEAIAHVGHAAT